MSGPPAPFIVGVGRSGTTLLRLMLDAHPDLAIPSETHFLGGFIGSAAVTLSRTDFLARLTSAPTFPNMAVEAGDLAAAVDAIEPFTAAEGIRAFYRLYAARFGKRRWGDKTPPYRARVMEISEFLPEAHFIHIIRDGRDVALSYRGLWFGPGDDIEAQARFWVDEITATRSQAENLAHYREVRYEDLVVNPEARLRDLADFLSLPYDFAMLDFHGSAGDRLAELREPFWPTGGKPVSVEALRAIHANTSDSVNQTSVGRWRAEMPSAARRAYEAIAAPMLSALGYDIDV